MLSYHIYVPINDGIILQRKVKSSRFVKRKDWVHPAGRFVSKLG